MLALLAVLAVCLLGRGAHAAGERTRVETKTEEASIKDVYWVSDTNFGYDSLGDALLWGSQWFDKATLDDSTCMIQGFSAQSETDSSRSLFARWWCGECCYSFCIEDTMEIMEEWSSTEFKECRMCHNCDRASCIQNQETTQESCGKMTSVLEVQGCAEMDPKAKPLETVFSTILIVVNSLMAVLLVGVTVYKFLAYRFDNQVLATTHEAEIKAYSADKQFVNFVIGENLNLESLYNKFWSQFSCKKKATLGVSYLINNILGVSYYWSLAADILVVQVVTHPHVLC